MSIFLSGWQLYFGVWGIIMDFCLNTFVACPTWEKLHKCRKADLLLVANIYDIPVSYSARKAVEGNYL